MKLTGNTRFRTGLFGAQILQVQFVDRMEDPMDGSHTGPEYSFWRDATVFDVQALNIHVSIAHRNIP